MRAAFFGAAGPVPAATSPNVSFVVQTTGGNARTSVMVDCSGTPAAELAAVGVDLRQLDAVVLTHGHTDHLYALPSLIHSALMLNRERPLCIAGNAATQQRAKDLLAIFGLLDRDGMFPLEWREIGREPLSLPRESTSPDEALLVSAYEVQHSLPALGLRFEHRGSCLAFSCDTRPCSAVARAAAGASVLIHEASGPAQDEPQLNAAGHSSARQAGLAAHSSGAELLLLVHLPPSAFDCDSERYLDEARSGFAGAVAIPRLRAWYEVPRAARGSRVKPRR